MVASPSLDETLDVEKLIPGSLSAIRTTSRALAGTASDFVAIAGMLSQVEVAGWKGAAADEFRKKWHDLPESWAAAAKSYRNAHSAFVEYQNAFDTARSAAEDAVVLYRRGQEATSAALAHFHAEQAARAAEQAGKPYVPGAKSLAIGQGFNDPGETFRREAQRDLDDARVRLHRAAHTASLTILDGVALAPKAPPTGWDQFWGGVNGVIEFPGNVVEGFLIAGWDTLASSWETAPAKWILEVIFTGPDATWKDLMTKGEAGASAVSAIIKDPSGSVGKLLIEALDLKEWGTNPGHVIGNGVFVAASFAVPGGAAVKSLRVVEDTDKLLVDGKSVTASAGVDSTGVREPAGGSFARPSIDGLSAGGPRVIIKFSKTQIESKFKHAPDFLVTEPRGADGFEAFEKALNDFVDSDSTTTVVGTFKGAPAVLNYDQSTSQVVIQSPNGEFVSGWVMTPQQLQHVIQRGSL